MSEYEDTDNQELDNNEGSEEHEQSQPEENLESQQETQAQEEEASQPVEEKPKKKKVNIGERLSQAQREKWHALDELKAIREENDRLRAMTDVSTRTALNHYDQSVQQRLMAAKEQKIRALESGDIMAQADADVALSMATSEFQQLNNMKAQQEVYQQPHYQQQQYTPPTREREVQEWASQNDWFHPSSDNYDDEMANEVHAYCNVFDNNLYRAGQADKIMSREYFDLLNEHIKAVKQNKYQSRGRDLQMKSGRGTVAPRSGYSGQSSGGSPRQPTLTADEADMARRLGVKDEDYLNHRKEDERNNGHRRIRR